MFRKRIGGVAVIILSFHIFLSLLVLGMPRAIVQSHPVAALYNQLILVGPFFQEDRLKNSAHLYVSYKVNDQWSPFTDHAQRQLEVYRKYPWRYESLHVGDLERYLSRQVGHSQGSATIDAVQRSRAFRELNQFVVEELVPMPVDSIWLLYGTNLYLPKSHTVRFDTIFTQRYNPSHIGPGKIY